MAFTDRLHNRGSISTGYDIDNSCKFEADNTERMYRAWGGGGGNDQTWTVSLWVKRTELGTLQHIWGAGVSGNDVLLVSFQTDNTLKFRSTKSGADDCVYVTNRVFRDTSAWMHIVVAVDTTSGTAGDRLRIYINGVEETSFVGTSKTDFAQNDNTLHNANSSYMEIATAIGEADRFCGYIAEVISISGSQLAPTTFGEFDGDSGIWIPKAYTGSFPQNSVYLEFKDSSSLGTDTSGNGQTFTLQNITAADQATDTPTNNFCTMNMLNRTNGNSKNQEGATKVTTDGGSGWCSMVATMGVTKGKWYWETQRSGGSSDSNDVVTGIVGSEDAYIPYSSAAQYYIGNVATSSSMGFYTTGVPNVRNGDGGSLSNSAGDIIMIGLDMDNSKIYFGVNGTWDALGTGGSSLHADFDGEFVLPAVAVYQGKQIKINFGGYASYTISSAASDADGYGTFEYAPPSGYYALCTKNLEEYG